MHIYSFSSSSVACPSRHLCFFIFIFPPPIQLNIEKLCFFRCLTMWKLSLLEWKLRSFLVPLFPPFLPSLSASDLLKSLEACIQENIPLESRQLPFNYSLEQSTLKIISGSSQSSVVEEVQVSWPLCKNTLLQVKNSTFKTSLTYSFKY